MTQPHLSVVGSDGRASGVICDETKLKGCQLFIDGEVVLSTPDAQIAMGAYNAKTIQMAQDIAIAGKTGNFKRSIMLKNHDLNHMLRCEYELGKINKGE